MFNQESTVTVTERLGAGNLRTRTGIQPELSLEDRYVAVSWPYRVLSRSGYTIGKFNHLADALAAFNAWAQATAIVVGTYVVIERKGGVA